MDTRGVGKRTALCTGLELVARGTGVPIYYNLRFLIMPRYRWHFVHTIHSEYSGTGV